VVIATTVTTGSGYSFTGLPAGSYKLRFTAPAGYGFTLKDQGSNDAIDSDADQTTGTTDAFTLAAGANDDTRDAGLVQADLSITKTDSTDPVGLGDNLTYTLTVHNSGPGTATGVTVTDTLPTSVTFVSATGSGSCSYASPTVTCALGNLAVGASVTVTIVVTPTAIGTIVNTAIVTANEIDPNTGDNSDAESTTVTGGSIGNRVWLDEDGDGLQGFFEVIWVAGVTVELLDGTTGVVIATTVTTGSGYSFTGLPAGSYKLRFTAPAGYGFTLKDQGSDDIDSDADQTTGTTDAFTLAAGTDDDTRDAGLVQADLTTTKTGPSAATVGESITYTIVVHNAGPTAARNVVVTDTLPTGTTFVSADWPSTFDSGGRLIFTVGNTRVGSEGDVTITIVVTVTSPGPLTNTVTTRSETPDPNGVNNTSSVTTFAYPQPAINIDDATVTEGNSGTTGAVFTVSLSNPSTQTVTVNFSTADGTSSPATGGTDYVVNSGTLTFSPGETTKSITVLVTGDTAVEPDETFFVNLTSPVNATIADGQGLGTVLNDDQLTGILCLGRVPTILGTPGNDHVKGTPGDDVIHGLGGKDVIDGRGGNDVICGGDGNDKLFGGDGDDLLDGGEGNDHLRGGDGDDVLTGGPGNDMLRGGRGNDDLFGGDGDDLLDGGQGTYRNDDDDEREWHDRGHDDDDDERDRRGGKPDHSDEHEDDDEDDYDVGGNDFLDGGAGKDRLYGRNGNDVLIGGPGRDRLHGGLGNDSLDGGDEDDVLKGGPGNDDLSGGDGHDDLDGGIGRDTLNGGLGNDRLSGGPGNDFLDGGAGDDYLDGGQGHDVIDGGPGTDFCVAGETVTNCERTRRAGRA
jgi:uncharacterized repeat protein (TIGR01451 family)